MDDTGKFMDVSIGEYMDTVHRDGFMSIEEERKGNPVKRRPCKFKVGDKVTLVDSPSEVANSMSAGDVAALVRYGAEVEETGFDFADSVEDRGWWSLSLKGFPYIFMECDLKLIEDKEKVVLTQSEQSFLQATIEEEEDTKVELKKTKMIVSQCGGEPEAEVICACGGRFMVDAITGDNLLYNGKELVEQCPKCSCVNEEKW